jgi:hypothetical protein
MPNRASLWIGFAMLALFLAAMAPSPVRADYRSAVSAFEKENYELAHRQFQALARGGDAAAQYHLGLMFKDGLGVRKDLVAALGWFFCAAEPDGQVDKDMAGKAAKWVEQLSYSLDGASIRMAQERALACRFASAQVSAVSSYEKKEYEVARREFQFLAQNGDTDAQYRLGLMFKDGLGGPKDPIAALGGFSCAAQSDRQADKDVAREAAKWVEQLSSSLDGASVRTARKRALSCRAMAESPARPDTQEVSRSTGSGTWFDWDAFKSKLDQLIERLSQVEVAVPDGGAWSDPAAASKPSTFSVGSFVAVPNRRSLWSKAFFLPADGTIVGSQHVAWELGADKFYRDLRAIARDGDDITLGFFAVLWWLLIGKTLLSIGSALMRVLRSFGAR